MEDLDYVRNYVGNDEPTDAEIYAVLAETGSAPLAATQILQRRKADLAGIVPFSVTGFTQGSPSASISAIDSQLEELSLVTGIGGEGMLTTSQLVRPDRCHR